MENGINPYILECKRFVAPGQKKSVPRVVKDYELDFNVHGTRTLWVNDAKYELQAGGVAYRMPGDVVCSVGDYDCYILTIDFAGSAVHLPYSRNVPGSMQVRSESQLLALFEPVMEGAHSAEIRARFDALTRLTDWNCTTGRAILMEILYLLNADCARKIAQTSTPVITPAEQALQYLRENLAEQISLDTLARSVHLDPSYLVRLFRRQYGQTPMACLIALRMNRARELLLNTNLSVAEISASCGYNSSSYFATQYKRYFRITPGAQRRHEMEIQARKCQISGLEK